MSTKFRIKIGTFEVECEGSEEFVKNELLKLCSSVSEFSKESDFVVPPEKTEAPKQHEQAKKHTPKSKIQLTTGNIASKLKSETAPDLILAACAHLMIVQGNETVTRKDILHQMKTAKNHYKKHMGSNLSQSLKTLVGNDKLNEPSTNTYVLPDQIRIEMESKLAPK